VTKDINTTEHCEYVARMAHGAAHELDNFLTTIIANLSFLESDPGVPDHCRTAIRLASTAAQRNAAFSERLRGFYRQRDIEPQRLDAAAFMTRVAATWQSEFESDVEIETQFDDGEFHLFADPKALATILGQLAANAVAAAGQNKLVLTLGLTRRRGGGAAENAALGDGSDFIVVSVRDNGTGMSNEQCARAFEPFFTTLSPSTGHGLGLCIVRDFALRSGGYVTLDSQPRQGTTVHLCLPPESSAKGEARNRR